MNEFEEIECEKNVNNLCKDNSWILLIILLAFAGNIHKGDEEQCTEQTMDTTIQQEV